MAFQSEIKWHSLNIKEVFERIRTSKEGLSEVEAKKRLIEHGFNEIIREKVTPSWRIFIDQFNNVLIILLIVATGFSLIIGEVLDAIVIFAIVIASAVLGFAQEYRSERAVQLLKKLAAPSATVIREGRERVVSSREIVPGDIVVLRAGDRVPADIRLFEVYNLKVDEASLTGESIPIEKSVEPLPENIIISDRVNMTFSGTVVTYGRGLGVVVATGMNTEFGKIAKTVQEEEKVETPLEKRMNAIGKWLTIFALSVCGFVAFLGILKGHELIEMILWGISLAVAAVPEALPAVVTGSLAIGMYEMAKRKAIVRRLPAVETLGSTSIICADKTGTMTKGEMTVKKIFVEDKIIEVSGVGYEPKGEFYFEGKKVEPLKIETLHMLLKASALCNDAKLFYDGGRWSISGDTTEGALIIAAKKAGIGDEELSKYFRVNEIPFTSERKRMTTIHSMPETDKKLVVMKGAPEVVLERCKWVMKDGKRVKLIEEEKRKILEINERMASEALRNLAIAYKEVKEIPEKIDEKEFETDFIFLGIEGMIDPPREEVKDAIKLCKEAGIKVVMITGDHKLTAVAVAKELGLLDEKDNLVLTGAELEKMSEEEFNRIVEDVKVYARVSPEHKTKIVKSLKSKGYVVAMTGDGINDAAALKMADIGVAMGITGTEVTKETSDMILADDNFSTIVNAVKEGRRIFDNIKKYLTYLLESNITEITVMFVAMLVGLPLPLTAVQILWVNLTTDGLPAIALGIDPPEKDVMKRKPRNPKSGLMSKKEIIIFFIMLPALYTVILLLNFLLTMSTETTYFSTFDENELIIPRTQLLTTFIICELAIAISCHSLSHPIIKAQPFSNKYLWFAIASSLIIQLTVLYTPFLHDALGVTYPTLEDMILAIISAIIIFTSLEVAKVIALKRK
ncbi:MAG: cation-translocating P-type ATPase [Nitrososphaeria archaeon]|nr:cation-translocating P-type ATPase [Nitrososphaeria archaeon]